MIMVTFFKFLMNQNMKKVILLIFCSVLTGLAFAQEIDLYTHGNYNNPIFTICYGDCGKITGQPRNSLYTYHDGGFSSDLSRAQMHFDDDEYSIDEMLGFVEQNIEKRLADLSLKYNQYNQKIDQEIQDVLADDEDIIEDLKSQIDLTHTAFQNNLADPSFTLSSELLEEISLLSNLNLNLPAITEKINNLGLGPNSSYTLSQESIAPEGFEFTGFDFRNDLYDDIKKKAHKEAVHEWLNQGKDYDDVLARFDQFTSRGEPDPVFDNKEALLLNFHIAEQALQTSLKLSEDFDKIKAEYPGVSENIIREWVKAGKTKRYEAIGYMPLSDESFRFTVMDMGIVRREIVSVVEHIQQDFVIPQFACNIYTGTLANKLYNIDIDLFKKNGQWLNANNLALKAAGDDRFKLIGVASSQENLDRAAYMATIGKPVIAIWANKTGGHGHVNLLLPGMTDFRSTTWERYVPWVTNYSITEGNECSGCFNEGRLSNAFGKNKMDAVIFYYLED